MQKFIVIIMVLVTFVACGGSKNSSKEGKKLVYDEILNEVAKENFEDACADINLDVSKIDSMEQLPDWGSGERFRFGYESASLDLYMLGDDTVDSINLYGIHVYQRGYEPYDINEYIIDYSMANEIQMWAIEDVKSMLNRPEAADFGWFNWGYARRGDMYLVQSSVEAKNFFNASEDITFRAQYKVEGDTHTLVYLSLGADVYVDNRPPEEERDRIDSMDNSSNPNAIVLADGELGEYGKEVVIGGDTYYQYHIPSGNYELTCLIRCTVLVVGENSEDVIFSQAVAENEKVSIEIPQGYHIELSMNGKVELVKSE